MQQREGGRLMRSRWLRFVETMKDSGIRVGADTQKTFEKLDRRYSEEHRYYHNWTHISTCLDELEAAGGLVRHPIPLEMAIWFHDAVYDPGAPDNEELSAEAAREAGEQMNIPPSTIRKVEELILATRYPNREDASRASCAQDRALIRDIDLSILGRPPEVFDRYEEAISREYGFLPERERRQRRIVVLSKFLALPRIYETGRFRKQYEQQARRNLTRSVRRLERFLGG
jgi:predicted metal-dependent HD superfamily phosphohydrolase